MFEREPEPHRAACASGYAPGSAGPEDQVGILFLDVRHAVVQILEDGTIGMRVGDLAIGLRVAHSGYAFDIVFPRLP